MRNEDKVLYFGKRGLEIYLAKNDYNRTYEDIGKKYGLSGSRIGQIYRRTEREIKYGMMETNYNYEFYKVWLIKYYMPDMRKFKLSKEDFLKILTSGL